MRSRLLAFAALAVSAPLLSVAAPTGAGVVPLGTLGTVPTLWPVADLAPVVEATPNPAPAGEVEFQVRVRNDGPVAATGVELTFDVTQVTDEARTSQGKCSTPIAGTTTCVLGSIATGAEAVVSVATWVTGFEDGLFGTAIVTSGSTDPDPSDDIVTTEVIVAGPDDM